MENFSKLALHPNRYGKTDLVELQIELQPGAVPKRSKVRPLNPDQQANLKEQLDEWIQQGITEPANSPWASPLVPVKKKDGRTRWVTDLRLNDVAYPMMNIQENLQKLKDAKIFTSIDACGAYHTIQIEEGSRDCTAFINPLRYISLYKDAFGPVKRRKCLQPDVGPGPGTLSCGVLATYLDDILVYSMDTWDNLKHLKSIVEAHTKAGIKIQPKKTKIFQTETEYLGHKVSQG